METLEKWFEVVRTILTDDGVADGWPSKTLQQIKSAAEIYYLQLDYHERFILEERYPPLGAFLDTYESLPYGMRTLVVLAHTHSDFCTLSRDPKVEFTLEIEDVGFRSGWDWIHTHFKVRKEVEGELARFDAITAPILQKDELHYEYAQHECVFHLDS